MVSKLHLDSWSLSITRQVFWSFIQKIMNKYLLLVEKKWPLILCNSSHQKGRGYFPTSWFWASFVTCFEKPNAMLCDFQSSLLKSDSFHSHPLWSQVGKGHMKQNWDTPANCETYAWSSKISQPPINSSLTTNVYVNPIGTTWSSGWAMPAQLCPKC